MPSNNPYDAVPDIDFVPETTEEILEELVDTYEQVLSEETGQTEKLNPLYPPLMIFFGKPV